MKNNKISNKNPEDVKDINDKTITIVSNKAHDLSPMPNGEPIIILTNKGVKILDEPGQYKDVMPWSVLASAVEGSELINDVAVVTVEDNGLRRKVLYTYPANEVYDPLENFEDNILNKNELYNLMDKRVEALADMVRTVRENLVGGTFREVAFSISTLDKKASKFFVDNMKSFYLNIAKKSDKYSSSNEEFKVLNIVGQQSSDMLESSMNPIFDVKQSMCNSAVFQI